MSKTHTFLLVSLLGIIPVQETSELFSSGDSYPNPQKSGCTQEAACVPKAVFNAEGCIIDEVLPDMFENYAQNLKTRQDFIEKIAQDGKVINSTSNIADLNVNRNSKADPLIQKMEATQLPFEDVTEQMCKMFNLSSDSINNELPYVDIKDELGSQYLQACKQTTAPDATCDPSSTYRTINGQCNNLQNPKWGSAKSCQRRLMPANYKGTSEFRASVNGEPLPGGRVLSLNVHYHYDRPNYEWTHMFVFFGQLLDHDIIHTPQSTTIDNLSINCCPAEDKNHPQCAPIRIPENDPFYSQHNISCMNFVRSAICPTCTFGPRQVMNQVTSFIDASFIYGNTKTETQSLRTNDGTGRLRTYKSAYGDLLPQSSDPKNDLCSSPEETCFECGDTRCNQHTVLTSLHTVTLREHNRIADALKQINPHWDGEKIFQETRRIMGAMIQAITYTEYLPIVLGHRAMTFYKLWPGRDTVYKPREDPTTLVEFTTAAFRFGHSLINYIVAYRPLNATNQLRYLRDDFFQPSEIYNGLVGPIVAGACHSPSQEFDRHLVPDVTNYLYRKRGKATGLDLAAINIYRGRDHGLPTYTETIYFCFQIRIANFWDLVANNLMQPEQMKVLQYNYRFVQDVDLWTGILSETNEEGAVVGPTAACIIGLQFRKLRYGDRFYFEHKEQAGSFSNEQLEELRKVTLSQIFCSNTKIQRLPKNAMLYPSKNNPEIECKDLKGFDVSSWKENNDLTKS